MTAVPTSCSESTLTDRYQTTIPAPVRQVLGLSKRDKISYTIQADGSVVMSRADSDESDPVLETFLAFLADDMERNPQQVQGVSSELLERANSLVDGVEVDFDAPLSDEDE